MKTGHVPIELEHHRARRGARSWLVFLAGFALGVLAGLGLALVWAGVFA